MLLVRARRETRKDEGHNCRPARSIMPRHLQPIFRHHNLRVLTRKVLVHNQEDHARHRMTDAASLENAQHSALSPNQRALSSRRVVATPEQDARISLQERAELYRLSKQLLLLGQHQEVGENHL